MTTVRFSDISLSTRTVTLAEPVHNANGAWSERESVLIRLVDQDGITGLGEASPLPNYSPEEMKTARSALSSWRRRLGPDAELELDEERPLALLDQLMELASTSSAAARFGLETALLDWLGHRLGVPAATLLVGGRRVRSEVPVATLAPDLKPKEVVTHAKQAFERGIRIVKVKVGVPGHIEPELEALAALRSAFGRDITLRLDANGSLPPSSVQDYLEVFARFRPELIEEPCALEVLMRLDRSPIPIALDESLRDPALGDRLPGLLESGIVKFLVLKPTLLGGARPCLELAALAERYQRGATASHCWEGPIAHAAVCSLALALPGRLIACGVDRHPVLEAWPPFEHHALRGPSVVFSTEPGMPIDGEMVWSPGALSARR